MSRAKWTAVAILVLCLGAAYTPVSNAVFAARLMLAMRSLASGDTGQGFKVVMERISLRRGSGFLEALVYRPEDAGSVSRALVLVPGISELGCYHPRLMALSRSLAAKGFMVVTPDIRMFREFRMSPEALDEIRFWFERVQSLNRDGRPARTGLAGISFSGTLALIVAAQPEIRDRVAWVFAIGPYDDPMRCSQEWFAAGPVTVGPGYFPTRYYARWIIMLAALDLVRDQSERAFLRSVLVDLLLQRNIPAAPRALSAESARFYRLATMRENEDDTDLARDIEAYLKPLLYDQITPHLASSEVRCPVFLVHGSEDDLIPPRESRRLCERLRSKCLLLISPFLTHTHPNEKSMTFVEKGRAAAEMFRFFFAFARSAG